MSRRAELADRLGGYRVMAGPELDHLAAVTEGQPLEAAFYAVRNWKAWLGAATPEALFLVRAPKVFGRRREAAFAWADLTSVRAGGTLSVDLEFGSERVELRFMAPQQEYIALLAAARGPGETPVGELHELARTKLGKTLAFGWAPTIEGLPDRLEPEERVERLAVARTDFNGLLVVTDRRVLLLDVGVRGERFWEVPRASIRAVEPIDDHKLRLTLDDGTVEFSYVTPPDRRDEIAFVLRP